MAGTARIDVFRLSGAQGGRKCVVQRTSGCCRRDGETVLRTPDFVLWIRPTVTRRAGDVNPPVTVRARVAGTASGTHRGLTGRLTSTARHRTFFCDSFGQWLGLSGDHGLRRGDFLHIADIVGAASEREFVADVPGETESLEQANGPPGDVQFPPFVPCGGD